MPFTQKTTPSYSTTTTTLLHLAGLLRQRYAKPPRFNLFTTLRSGSDEVRLHSRFLAALLDPQAHELGTRPLSHFLAHIGVDDFEIEGVRVECERFNVDVLVTNNRRQALVIENKIYAGDQPEQLQRYYKSIHSGGYTEIHMRYLSLDGHAPDADSLGDLGMLGHDERPGSYACLGYHTNILPWLRKCLGDAALDPPLRESIAQYHDLISQLTGHDMEANHLTTLTDTLLQGDNLLAAHDIQLAYSEALIRLQVQLWQELKSTVHRDYPKMDNYRTEDSCTEGDLETTCRNFVQQNRNNKWYGLYYRIPGDPEAYACFEIDRAIYLGIYCDKSVDPVEYRRIADCLDDQGIIGSRNDWWPIFKFDSQSVSLKAPSAQELETLNDPQRRQAYVQTMVNELASLWQLAARVEQ